MKRGFVFVLSTCAFIGACSQSPVEPPSVAAERGFFSSKTPYQPQQDWKSYEPAPAGFQAIHIQHVARHGSRALSSRKYDDLSYQIWQQAEKEQALTPLGKQLGPIVSEIMQTHEALGYGNLTVLGEREHEAMAERLLQRHPALFDNITAERRILVLDSGEPRARDSAQSFLNGLIRTQPALATAAEPPQADTERLYFHRSPAAEAYRTYKDNDPRLLAKLDEIFSLPKNRQVARAMLERLYQPEFVDRLANGAYEFRDTGKGSTVVRDEVDAAYMLYNLYIIVPGLKPDNDWQFSRFIADKHAEWMAYLSDAEDFYERGPAFVGEDITYRMANVLLDDFFANIDAVRAGESDLIATVRFSHAQVLIPFASVLGLPGSTDALPEQVTYRYDNNAWRGEAITPMAANVQWEVFADDNGTYLVRMLHQEREVPFKSDCEPYGETRFYVEFDELKRCYGYL
ncbi:histidine-type phosphatase [Alkalilimnicola ehrlichii]|uniref:histidine-type phosphatase n=1 Tax=Alkalilimnicola ehrlichii TaxID=351052 RepID=UPI0015F25278|nr:histidine-type phosphatase [Alkalilimnicola ehrlichii]